MTKLKELVIKEKEWLRGESHDPSFLCRASDKKKCCLGFLGNACGYTDAALEGKKSPIDVTIRKKSLVGKWPKLLLSNKQLLMDILDTNDNPNISDDERIGKLKPLFKTLGYNLVFEK